ncbi:MAG: alanine--tRNA ligase [Candidatus Saccharimonadales bacterium]|nr:alanine--tRNA ligase [Candidatus Saccharimonadales bacterium]
MTTQEIRQKYFDYFQKQGHTIIPRANLVPQDDPTTLFTGSGMQQLLPYLLGAKHPEGKRVADSQTCIRAEDVDEVGDNRHTTFFEMLGNWSLGDYFKKEQLAWFWDFLTEEVGLDPNKLYATCFIGDKKFDLPKDDESAEIWKKLYQKAGIEPTTKDIGSEKDGYEKGFADARITFYDGSKNWWSRAGAPKNMPEGEPGGPDSEVFYLFDEMEHDKSFGEHCHPNCDCGRFMEVGNSVFMEYLRTKDSFEPLPKKNVDFGGGLERIAAAKNDDADMFKISLIWPIIEKLVELSGKPYEDHVEAKRIIADHMRGAFWLGVDGIVPSNKEQGYVMRRLVRRSILKAHELGIDSGLCEALSPVIVGMYEADFPEVKNNAKKVSEVLAKEETIFRQTLKKGVRVFEKEVKGQLDGAEVFKLYDTYGFPTELSLEQAKERGIGIDGGWQKDFNRLMKEQQERSRSATKGQFKGGLGGHSDTHKRFHTANHLMYQALREVLGDHVVQRGSNITEERIRFDFSHDSKVTEEEIKAVEDIVNEQIDNALPVSFKEYPTKEALARGALGQFGDRYGETVKIYQMGEGEKPFSFEICGGPHADNTADLKEMGRFKIIKEQSSSAGVRRIKAVIE